MSVGFDYVSLKRDLINKYWMQEVLDICAALIISGERSCFDRDAVVNFEIKDKMQF